MNYRHIYHAGNFADIHKHLILMLALSYLQQKDKGLMVLDAFAGTGLYDFNSIEAGKTGEYLEGVAKLMETPAQNPDLKQFQDMIAPLWALRHYAGSPVLCADLLRTQDRLIANELHPEDYATLRENLRHYKNVHVTQDDAYQSIRAHLPPAERRGLILIDPPFEQPDEFEKLVKQMAEWKKRFATGIFMIWYPIKADQPIKKLHEAAKDLDINRTWVSEILLQPRHVPGQLNGAGMLVFNTPYGLPERIEALAPELGDRIAHARIENFMLNER